MFSRIEFIRDDIKYMPLCKNDYITYKIFCCIKDLTCLSDTSYYTLGVNGFCDYFQLSYRCIYDKIKWLVSKGLIFEYPGQKGNYTYYRVNTDKLIDFNDNIESIRLELKNAKNEIKRLNNLIYNYNEACRLDPQAKASGSSGSKWWDDLKAKLDEEEGQQLSIDDIK